MKLFKLVITAFLLMTGYTGSARAATLEVCQSGCAYSSIQQAIEAALDGDLVLVSEGVYPENINFSGKAIEVRSVSGAATTIIEGQTGGSYVGEQAAGQDSCPDIPEIARHKTKKLKKFIKNLKRRKKYRHDVSLTKIDVKKKIKKCDKTYKIKVRVKNETKTPETAQVVLYKDGEELHRWTDVQLKGRREHKLTYLYSPREDSCKESVCWSAEVITPDDQISANNFARTKKTKLKCACDGGGIQSESAVTFNSNEGQLSILDGFTITGGNATNGGGIICEHASPLIRNCLIQNNTASVSGGGVYFNYSQARMVDCDIISNSASQSGGGISIVYGLVTLERCLISGNKSGGSGGGLDIENSPSILINILISRNIALDGGGISTNSSPVITNSTVADNTASGRGGGIYCPYSEPVIVNSIFWGNYEEIFGNATLTYSIVQGGYNSTAGELIAQGGYEGTGNLNADPLFTDSAAGDYHLQSDSPAIDTALPSSSPAYDLEGNDRPQLLGADIGAYEFLLSSCQPWAAFTASPERVDTVNGSVSFEAIGSFDRTGETFSWDFGDGLSGLGKTTSHVYTQVGYYSVELTVSTSCGSSSFLRENHIIAGPAGIILDVPGSFPTIQAAIDAAINGDIIVVAPGIYTENINFKGKKITVKSSHGASVTIIDGNASGSVVTFNSAETEESILEGLTIQNGDATSGGGIFILDSSPTILDCLVTANTADSGGGIYAGNGNPLIRRTQIMQNSAEFGGGVSLLSAQARLINCLIVSNTATTGGGIYDEEASPSILNCTVYANSASFGNGMYTYSSYPSVTNSLFWDAVPEISTNFSFPTITYSYVLGGYAGTGNIDTDFYRDPLLVDQVNGNYSPENNSPLVDKGVTAGAPTVDLNQNTRDAEVDIGAYEFFIENTDPVVTINTPSGGETFTGDSLVLSWDVTDEEQQNIDELSADIYYRRGLVGDWTPIVGNIGCTHNIEASYDWDIGALMNGNDYTIRILVNDRFGGYAETVSDSTFTIDRIPPFFLGIVSAEDANSDGAVDLSWSAANDPSQPITYNIYTASSPGGQDFSSPIATTQKTFLQLMGLINDQTYYFVVRAQDFWEYEETNTVELSATPTLDITPPSFAGLASASDANIDGIVDLSWSAASEPNRPVTYNIYFATVPGAQNFSTPDATTLSTSYQVTGLINDQVYYIVVRAKDRYGNEDGNKVERNVIPTLDNTPPSFDGLTSAIDTNINGTVDLSWSAASESNGPVTYNIYFATAPGAQNFTNPGPTTQDTSYRVTGLTNDQIYYFVVRAEDVLGNEDVNMVEHSATPTLDTTPPDFAGLVSAQDNKTDGAVNLTWNVATDKNSPITYNIYYATSSNGQDFTAGPNVSTQNFFYKVFGLINNQTYYFVVRAKDGLGNEDTNMIEFSATPTFDISNIPEGATAYWRFGEGTGNKTFDETANDNDGTITGARWAAGKHNVALDFNGTNDYMSVPHSDSLNITGAITIEAWVFMDSSGFYPTVVSKSGSNWGYLFQFQDNTRKINLYLDGANPCWSNIATTAVPLSQWTHIVATYDGVNAVKYYFNGTPDGTYNVTGGSISQNKANLHIGGRKLSENYFFDGAIDEVVIYNRVLPDSDVLERYVNETADTKSPMFSGITTATDARVGGTIDLAWSAASDPSNPITYNIYYATTPGGYVSAGGVTTNTSYRLTGLTDNQVYYFVVRAKDAIGNEDDNMVELSAVPTSNPVTP